MSTGILFFVALLNRFLEGILRRVGQEVVRGVERVIRRFESILIAALDDDLVEIEVEHLVELIVLRNVDRVIVLVVDGVELRKVIRIAFQEVDDGIAHLQLHVIVHEANDLVGKLLRRRANEILQGIVAADIADCPLRSRNGHVEGGAAGAFGVLEGDFVGAACVCNPRSPSHCPNR